ncbi:hypothetical protein BESB_018260 [Besnoitia besnoiti]|uniref:Uncharacterized protein n=1 Tax=Besnoitia besnoiti TaxID=94643 RepID=A0A2A9M1Y3_BESBE|nr:hypothetical protein BESB_018260 [Besnoitia besnoiti]PFH32508.1 hypothetical protein BESB_018260 [Besnoitia besnoiti]
MCFSGGTLWARALRRGAGTPGFSGSDGALRACDPRRQGGTKARSASVRSGAEVGGMTCSLRCDASPAEALQATSEGGRYAGLTAQSSGEGSGPAATQPAPLKSEDAEFPRLPTKRRRRGSSSSPEACVAAFPAQAADSSREEAEEPNGDRGRRGEGQEGPGEGGQARRERRRDIHAASSDLAGKREPEDMLAAEPRERGLRERLGNPEGGAPHGGGGKGDRKTNLSGAADWKTTDTAEATRTQDNSVGDGLPSASPLSPVPSGCSLSSPAGCSPDISMCAASPGFSRAPSAPFDCVARPDSSPLAPVSLPGPPCVISSSGGVRISSACAVSHPGSSSSSLAAGGGAASSSSAAQGQATPAAAGAIAPPTSASCATPLCFPLPLSAIPSSIGLYLDPFVRGPALPHCPSCADGEGLPSRLSSPPRSDSTPSSCSASLPSPTDGRHTPPEGANAGVCCCGFPRRPFPRLCLPPPRPVLPGLRRACPRLVPSVHPPPSRRSREAGLCDSAVPSPAAAISETVAGETSPVSPPRTSSTSTSPLSPAQSCRSGDSARVKSPSASSIPFSLFATQLCSRSLLAFIASEDGRLARWKQMLNNLQFGVRAFLNNPEVIYCRGLTRGAQSRLLHLLVNMLPLWIYLAVRPSRAGLDDCRDEGAGEPNRAVEPQRPSPEIKTEAAQRTRTDTPQAAESGGATEQRENVLVEDIDGVHGRQACCESGRLLRPRCQDAKRFLSSINEKGRQGSASSRVQRSGGPDEVNAEERVCRVGERSRGRRRTRSKTRLAGESIEHIHSGEQPVERDDDEPSSAAVVHSGRSGKDEGEGAASARPSGSRSVSRCKYATETDISVVPLQEAAADSREGETGDVSSEGRHTRESPLTEATRRRGKRTDGGKAGLDAAVASHGVREGAAVLSTAEERPESDGLQKRRGADVPEGREQALAADAVSVSPPRRAESLATACAVGPSSACSPTPPRVASSTPASPSPPERVPTQPRSTDSPESSMPPSSGASVLPPPAGTDACPSPPHPPSPGSVPSTSSFPPAAAPASCSAADGPRSLSEATPPSGPASLSRAVARGDSALLHASTAAAAAPRAAGPGRRTAVSVASQTSSAPRREGLASGGHAGNETKPASRQTPTEAATHGPQDQACGGSGGAASEACLSRDRTREGREPGRTAKVSDSGERPTREGDDADLGQERQATRSDAHGGRGKDADGGANRGPGAEDAVSEVNATKDVTRDAGPAQMGERRSAPERADVKEFPAHGGASQDSKPKSQDTRTAPQKGAERGVRRGRDVKEARGAASCGVASHEENPSLFPSALPVKTEKDDSVSQARPSLSLDSVCTPPSSRVSSPCAAGRVHLPCPPVANTEEASTEDAACLAEPSEKPQETESERPASASSLSSALASSARVPAPCAAQEAAKERAIHARVEAAPRGDVAYGEVAASRSRGRAPRTPRRCGVTGEREKRKLSEDGKKNRRDVADANPGSPGGHAQRRLSPRAPHDYAESPEADACSARATAAASVPDGVTGAAGSLWQSQDGRRGKRQRCCASAAMDAEMPQRSSALRRPAATARDATRGELASEARGNPHSEAEPLTTQGEGAEAANVVGDGPELEGRTDKAKNKEVKEALVEKIRATASTEAGAAEPVGKLEHLRRSGRIRKRVGDAREGAMEKPLARQAGDRGRRICGGPTQREAEQANGRGCSSCQEALLMRQRHDSRRFLGSSFLTPPSVVSARASSPHSPNASPSCSPSADSSPLWQLRSTPDPVERLEHLLLFYRRWLGDCRMGNPAREALLQHAELLLPDAFLFGLLRFFSHLSALEDAGFHQVKRMDAQPRRDRGRDADSSKAASECGQGRNCHKDEGNPEAVEAATGRDREDSRRCLSFSDARASSASCCGLARIASEIATGTEALCRSVLEGEETRVALERKKAISSSLLRGGSPNGSTTGGQSGGLSVVAGNSASTSVFPPLPLLKKETQKSTEVSLASAERRRFSGFGASVCASSCASSTSSSTPASPVRCRAAGAGRAGAQPPDAPSKQDAAAGRGRASTPSPSSRNRRRSSRAPTVSPPRRTRSQRSSSALASSTLVCSSVRRRRRGDGRSESLTRGGQAAHQRAPPPSCSSAVLLFSSPLSSRGRGGSAEDKVVKADACDAAKTDLFVSVEASCYLFSCSKISTLLATQIDALRTHPDSAALKKGCVSNAAAFSSARPPGNSPTSSAACSLSRCSTGPHGALTAAPALPVLACASSAPSPPVPALAPCAVWQCAFLSASSANLRSQLYRKLRELVVDFACVVGRLAAVHMDHRRCCLLRCRDLNAAARALDCLPSRALLLIVSQASSAEASLHARRGAGMSLRRQGEGKTTRKTDGKAGKLEPEDSLIQSHIQLMATERHLQGPVAPDRKAEREKDRKTRYSQAPPETEACNTPRGENVGEHESWPHKDGLSSRRRKQNLPSATLAERGKGHADEGGGGTSGEDAPRNLRHSTDPFLIRSEFATAVSSSDSDDSFCPSSSSSSEEDGDSSEDEVLRQWEMRAKSFPRPSRSWQPSSESDSSTFLVRIPWAGSAEACDETVMSSSALSASSPLPLTERSLSVADYLHHVAGCFCGCADSDFAPDEISASDEAEEDGDDDRDDEGLVYEEAEAEPNEQDLQDGEP